MATTIKQGTTSPKGSTPVKELNDIRRSLQDAGLTLLQAATAAISAAAHETLSATEAVIGAADDTFAAAEEKVRKIRKHLRKP